MAVPPSIDSAQELQNRPDDWLIGQARRSDIAPGEAGRLLAELQRRHMRSGLKSLEARKLVAGSVDRSRDWVDEKLSLYRSERQAPVVARRIAKLGGRTVGGRATPTLGASAQKI